MTGRTRMTMTEKTDLMLFYRLGKISVILFLLTLAFPGVCFSKEPVRPNSLFDVGPFVTLHFLDHDAFNNYVDKFGMEKLDPMTLGYGLRLRALLGPVQIATHLEGWGDSTSGKGSDATIWGLSGVWQMGFTLVRRPFLMVFYFGPGLNYDELNISGKNPLPDFSGWKLGVLGDVGLSMEYLFPMGGFSEEKDSFTKTNLPIGVSIGYAGEVVTDPWYERSGELLNGDHVRDRFMGWYLRFGINIGGGSYNRSGSAFEIPDEDDIPMPKRKKRKPPPPDEPDRSDEEEG